MQLNTLFSKEHYEAVETLLQSVLSRKGVDEKREIYYPDDCSRQVHLSYIPDLNGGHVLGDFFLVRDATEHHQAQLGLKKSTEGYGQRAINATSELAKRNNELLNENRTRGQNEERCRIMSDLMSDLIYVYDVHEEIDVGLDKPVVVETNPQNTPSTIGSNVTLSWPIELSTILPG
jgi:hypothetical protein